MATNVLCFLGRKKSVFNFFFVVVAAAVQSNVSTTHIYLLQQLKKNVKRESKTQNHPLTRALSQGGTCDRRLWPGPRMKALETRYNH